MTEFTFDCICVVSDITIVTNKKKQRAITSANYLELETYNLFFHFHFILCAAVSLYIFSHYPSVFVAHYICHPKEMLITMCQAQMRQDSHSS